MKRTIVVLSALILCAVCYVYADYGVEDRGSWPESWPKELEPLRKQSQTLVGPLVELQHYAIPFAKKEEFEAAWPHLLKVKTKGAPVVLRRGPSFWLDDEKAVGVCMHTPPKGQAPNTDIKAVNGNWEQTIWIELIVDGNIIDLNRIPLPADTPLIDERFKEAAK